MNHNYENRLFQIALRLFFVLSIAYQKSRVETKTSVTVDGRVIFHVDSVDQLNHDLSAYYNLTDIPSTNLQVIFNTRLVLTKPIDFYVFSSDPDPNTALYLQLRNIWGFTADGSKFLVLNPEPAGQTYLRIISATFDFYDRPGRRIDGSCRSLLMSFYGLDDDQYEKANKSLLIQDYIGPLSVEVHALFIHGSASDTYKICPLVFKPASFVNLDLLKVYNKQLLKTQLEFEDLSDTFSEDYELGFKTQSAEIHEAYKIAVGKALLNREIFKNTRMMMIMGVIESISDDAFSRFGQLQCLYLNLFHLRTLLHSSDLKWLTNINKHVDYDPNMWFDHGKAKIFERKAKVIHLADLIYDYDFPDEDFCLFKHFSHRQLVLPLIACNRTPKNETVLIDADKINKTSCTLQYLAMYSMFTKHIMPNYISNEPLDYYIFKIDQDTLTEQEKYCNFEERLRICFLDHANFTISTEEVEMLNLYDIKYFLLWAELLGPIITFPIICLCGFVFNLIIAIVIKNKHNQKEFFKGDRMYEYLFINSIFNMIECLLSILTLMGECMGPNSIFCSSLMLNMYFGYFKIYGIQYFGECMKTCSIITLLAFSIERYVVTSAKSMPSSLTKFRNVNLKYFIIGTIIISSLSCACKIFEYTLEPNIIDTMEFPELEVVYMREELWFIIIYVLHYTLNDGLLLLFNFIIDLKLFFELKRDLAAKKENLKLKSAHKESSKVLCEIKQAESNTNKLIIYSFFLYLLCRLPELVFYMHLLFNPRYSQDFVDYSSTCSISLCYLMANTIQYLYMLSYLSNIFFYFRFNKPFRLAIKNLLFKESE